MRYVIHVRGVMWDERLRFTVFGFVILFFMSESCAAG